MGGHGVYYFGSEWGPVWSCCEDGNEPSGLSSKANRDFLIIPRPRKEDQRTMQITALEASFFLRTVALPTSPVWCKSSSPKCSSSAKVVTSNISVKGMTRKSDVRGEAWQLEGRQVEDIFQWPQYSRWWIMSPPVPIGWEFGLQSRSECCGEWELSLPRSGCLSRASTQIADKQTGIITSGARIAQSV